MGVKARSLEEIVSSVLASLPATKGDEEQIQDIERKKASLLKAPAPPAEHFAYSDLDGVCSCYLCAELNLARSLFQCSLDSAVTTSPYYTVLRAALARHTIYSEISYLLRGSPQYEKIMEEVFWAILTSNARGFLGWAGQDTKMTAKAWLNRLAR